MHRPRHLHTVVAMRVASILIALSGVLLLAALGLAGYALIEINRPQLLGALGLFILFLCSLLGYRIMAASARCPLCMSPILLSRQCARSQKASTYLGSYRLEVAKNIIFRGNFRCPYCGEPTVCQPREAPQQPVQQDSYSRRSGPKDPESW